MKKNFKISTAILEAFEDGIYVMNQELKVEYMNGAMVAEFGDGVGKKCHKLINQSEENVPGVYPMMYLQVKPCAGRYTSLWLTKPTI